jgi:thiamine-monophosphate kinase
MGATTGVKTGAAAMPRKNEPVRPGEFELIARYFAPLAGEGAFNLMDDAALVTVTPGKALAMTQDAVMAGVHFFPDDPPQTIAMKALRVNLSDLAAKGATPKAFSLALGLHPDWTEAWVAEFASGLAGDCAAYGISLCGGDTFLAPGGPVISITAWGEVEASHYRSRLGAKPGDMLFVTGTIGDAALGLMVAHNDKRLMDLEGAAILHSLYLAPRPPVSFAPVIASHASASMDISDGFIGDLEKMARASNVDFEVSALKVPLSAQVRGAVDQVPELIGTVLTGGDDYQCLFTVPQAQMEDFQAAVASQEVQVTEVGIAKPGSGKVSVAGLSGKEFGSGKNSYSHF